MPLKVWSNHWYDLENSCLVYFLCWFIEYKFNHEFVFQNTNKLQGAKERASHINTKVSNWLRGPWGSTANVVALDYFSSTNIIDVAIYANIQKAFLKLNKDYIKFEITMK